MRLNPELLARYDARVPRYTSYPTAPHFHDGVDAAVYRELLSSLGGHEPVSLYFHIPFCVQMCWYCGCHTQIAARYAPIADYVKLLKAELGLVAASLAGRPSVSHIHWGGGTPTMLSTGDFAALMTQVGSLFEIGERTEIAVEIDPRTLTPKKIDALARAGVNRASLGVQDFNDHVQAAINRLQPFDMTADVVARLRRAGIHALNFDLMYGLPRQTVTNVEKTVELATSLSPDRIALFGYAHVPWMKTHQRKIDEAELPGAAERLDQSYAAAEALTKAGYRRIGLDHFAREHDALTLALDRGALHRNFQGYTTDDSRTLIGFGASAIGLLGDTYVQNAVPFRAYAAAIQNGELAVVRGVSLTDADRLRRDLIEHLMCDLTVDVTAVCAAHDVAPSTLAAEIEALEPLIRDGIVRLDRGRITVTEYGRPLVRSVCAVFDSYLDSSAVRYSRAV
ncbi:MAG: oxygen-independent coproporphyrinogen III oxidase [Rhodospirillales bacterium]|nr:oxygen-independent coproporphyrinogen III oxidase [Rhodospirillales bacterium]